MELFQLLSVYWCEPSLLPDSKLVAPPEINFCLSTGQSHTCVAKKEGPVKKLR